MGSKVEAMANGRKIAATTIFFVLVCSACAPKVPRIVISNLPVPDQDKIKLDVALRLTDAFRGSAVKRTDFGSTMAVPVGEDLCSNSELLARALFSNVSVVNGAAKIGKGATRVALIPRFISSVWAFRIFPVLEQKVAIVLEWKLTDLDGNVIWVDTITAEGKFPGNTFDRDENMRILLEAAFKDLFDKSYEAMYSSPEIRKFADRQMKKGV